MSDFITNKRRLFYEYSKVVSGERRNIYEIKAQTKKQKAFNDCDVYANTNWHVGT